MSKDNQKIKEVVSLLKDKSTREELGLFVVEGARSVRDIIENKVGIHSIFISQKAVNNFSDIVMRSLEVLGSDKIFCVDDKVFDKMTDTITSQGILAIANICIKKDLGLFRQGKKILYLDTISDPGNLGTIIRTALASGFNNIVLLDCVDAYNPKVVRSSMGAITKVNIYIEKEGHQILRTLKQGKYKILTATLDGTNIFTCKKNNDKIVLVIGSEAFGVSKEIQCLADKKITIPMQNTESLNAAVSAGILMYQLSEFA